MKRGIGMVVLGIGGLAAAVALTLGALALAGDDVGDVVQPTLTPSRSTTETPSPSQGDRSETPSPSVDDHGGSSSGSDDPAGDDNSGSGSSNSGSGSSDSGSDSSGSDDD